MAQSCKMFKNVEKYSRNEKKIDDGDNQIDIESLYDIEQVVKK